MMETWRKPEWILFSIWASQKSRIFSMEPFYPWFQVILDFDDVTTSNIHENLSFLLKYWKKLRICKNSPNSCKISLFNPCNVCHYLEGKWTHFWANITICLWIAWNFPISFYKYTVKFERMLKITWNIHRMCKT